MKSGLHPYLLPLEEAFSDAGDPEIAAGAAAYMKNISSFYGLKAPDRRMLIAAFIKQYGLPEVSEIDVIIDSAWKHPMREMQYAAMELLVKSRKSSDEFRIELYERMITNKSWWDTIDYIAPHLVSFHFDHFVQTKSPVIKRWMESDNIWLQRSCLLFQLKAKAKTDENLLFDLISKLAGHKAFFIRKAIGWSLREYAKTNPASVIQFVQSQPLSGLSKREALKHYTK